VKIRPVAVALIPHLAWVPCQQTGLGIACLAKKWIQAEIFSTMCLAINFLLPRHCFHTQRVFHEKNRYRSDSSRRDQHVLRGRLLAQWQVRECVRD
jgi:hypothetical protein